MSESKRRNAFSGTVLIMILTVMVVLIIMLMATLTVVSTAGQRIYTKYEENQAYYTARSALDVFTQKMLYDSQYTADGTNAQGYLIQQSLYTVKAQSDPDDPNKNMNIYGPVDKEYLEYTVSLPKLSDGTNVYGKFCDDDEPVVIRVEVLDRTYNADGDRTKDSIEFKVTATSSIGDVGGSAAVIMETDTVSGITSDRAITITGDGSGSEMDIRNTTVLGGLATREAIYLGNQGDYWGDIFLGNTVRVDGNGSRVVSADDQWMYFGDITDITNNFPMEGRYDLSDTNKRPNAYVPGNYNSPNNVTSGALDNEVNLIIGGNLSTGNNFTHYGNLYVMGNITAGLQFTVNGNLYVGGDCDFSTANNGANVTGDMFVSGTYKTRSDGDGNDLTVIGGSSTLGGASSTDMPEVVDTSDTDGKITVTWPGGTAKEVPTVLSLYTQYYRYGDISEGTITASENAFLSSDELINLRTPDSDFEYPVDFKRIHEYKASSSITNINLNSGSYTISSPGVYALESCGNALGHTLTVEPGGLIELFINPGFYENGSIVVKAGAKLKVYGEPGTYGFRNFPIVTDNILDNSVDLYVGDSGTLMDIPISFYFEGESVISLDGNTLWVGNFYGPRTSINSTAAYTLQNGSGSRLYYNGVHYDRPGAGFSFIGSLLCDKYSAGDNKGGVAFVKADGSSTPPAPGLPWLTFSYVKYTRN